MRRLLAPPPPDLALRQFHEMQLAGWGVKLMLAHLPPGSTLDEARKLYQRMAQESRAPCSFLDESLGIRRV